MADINDIVGSIDRALWRVRDRQINNITPFTYRDGLTYLEVLENIRRAVLETIEYVVKFGADQDKILKNLNDVVSNFITEVEKTHGEWNKTLDAKQKLVLDTIEEFKSKLIKSAIEPKAYNGIYGNVSRGLLEFNFMDGSKATVPTLETLNEKNTKDFRARREIEETVDAGLKNRYTKSESDSKYVAKTDYRAIIIGNSNATYPWMNRVLSERGYTPHNHAIGGAAFYKGWNGAYINQLNTAKQAAINGGYNSKIRCVAFTCMLNDIRFKHNISAEATECATFVKQNWPDAEIICIPVIFNKSTLNYGSGMAYSIAARTNEFKEAFADMKPLVCDGSKSWFWEGSESGHNWVKGNDEVHLTDEGYERAANYTIAWLNGDSGWRNKGWTSMESFGEEANPPNKSSMSGLWMKREFDRVQIHGSFNVKREVGIDNNLWWIPAWAAPTEEILLTSFSGFRELAIFKIDTEGHLINVTSMKTGTNYFFENTYCIW